MSSLMDFGSLVKSLGAVLYCPLFVGDIDKRDAYGGSLSVANGSPNFTPGPRGHLLNINGGRLSVADSGARAELRIDPGTIMAFSPGFRFATATEVNYRLLSKVDAGGSHFDWYITDTGIVLADASGAPSWADNPDEATSLAVTFETGSNPNLWLDGVNRGAAGAATSITANDADLSVGAYYTNANSCPVPLTCMVMFPSILTAQNISDLHHVFKWTFQSTVEPQLASTRPLQIANPLMFLSGDVVDSQAVDRSANGINMAKKNAVEMEPDVPSGGHGFEAHGAVRGDANMIVTDTDLDDHAAKTFAFWIRRDGNGESNAGRVFDKGASIISCYVDNSGDLYFEESWSGGLASWSIAGVAQTGRFVHVVIRHDGVAGTVPEISIDGVDTVVTTNTPSSGTRNSDVGAFAMLDRNAFGRELDGVVSDFVWFSRYLTDVDTKWLYLRSSLRSFDRGYLFSYPDSLVSKTEGEVGPFSIGSGTHQWGSDNVLDCVASGYLHTPSKQAFGATYFEMSKDLDASATEFAFIASDVAAIATATQFGYSVLIDTDESVKLRRLNGSGAATNLITSAASYVALGTKYQFLPVRSSAGVFTLWIRGGAYAVWTLVGTSAADTTYTSSIYSVADLDAGDTFSGLFYLPYGYGIAPSDIPWLAD